MWEYEDAEARDRDRSSWKPYAHTCQYVAGMRTTDAQGGPPMDYTIEVRRFAQRWADAGHPLPPDYDNPHRARSNGYPPWLSFLTCYHFGYHFEHHEYPYVPWWGLSSVRHREKLS